MFCLKKMAKNIIIIYKNYWNQEKRAYLPLGHGGAIKKRKSTSLWYTKAKKGLR
jgi:hypothetical protein